MQQPGRAAEIKAIGIGKSFGSFRALDNLSLDIGRGEFLTLLGPSGSGKTTFLMILAGFVQPTEGRLFSDGVDITDRPAEQRAAGMVFQGYALFPHMSVEANIAFPLKVRKKSRGRHQAPRRRDDRARRAERPREEASGAAFRWPAAARGARPRAGVRAGRAVARRAVLGARQGFARPDAGRDEAAASGDRHHLRLRHPRPERGAWRCRRASRSSTMANCCRSARRDEVYDRPANRFVAEFLGEINMLPLKGDTQRRQRRRPACAKTALSACAAAPTASAATPSWRSGPNTCRSPARRRRARTAIAATATNSTYLGAATRLDLTTRQGAKVTVSVPNEVAAAALSKGNSVWLTWPAEKGFLLPDGGR